MGIKAIVYSRDGEIFYGNKGIIDEARDDWEAGESEEVGYYTGERREIDVANLIPNHMVNEIIGYMDEALYDIVGEVSEDALDMSGEKKKELHEIIRNFMQDNCSCSCWAVDNVQYHSFLDEDKGSV